jgi:chromosome segregation ATPase
MKYLRNGQVVEILCELPDQRGFVVLKYYDNPEGGQYLDDQKKVVERVYDSPPVEHIDKRVREAEAKLRDLEGAIHNANRELRTVEQERKAILGKLQQMPALRRLEAWIDGKVTHFVTSSYGHIEVVPKNKMICDGDSGNRGRLADGRMKLVTLFGDADGSLMWGANQYRDGSGSTNTECHLCCSEQEAKELAATMIDRDLASKENEYWMESLIDSADKIGHAIDERYRNILAMKKSEKAHKAVEEARKKLADAEKQLAGFTIPVMTGESA